MKTGVEIIKIGRSEDNDIVLSGKYTSVSRYHAEIFINHDEDLFILTDLGSTNGTYVNGKRITESILLKKRDVVKIGDSPPIDWKSYITGSTRTGIPVPQPVIEEEEVSEIPVKNGSKVTNYVFGSLLTLLVLVALIFIVDEFYDSNPETEEAETAETKVNDGGETEMNDGGEREDIPDRPQSNGNSLSYNYDCLENGLLTDGSDLEKEIVDAFDVEVSLKEERDVGKQLHEGVKQDYILVFDERLDKIRDICANLVRQVENPRFTFKIFLIESDAVNAFTAGGYIYVTTEMYNYVLNDDELACVIGHEIAHNQMGHIAYKLKKEKANNLLFGEIFGSEATNLSFFLTTGFNQKRETESDFHGIDYATRANYNSCSVSKLWQRMSEDEGDQNALDNIRRSHPYSEKRSKCCSDHILRNYNYSCPN